MSNLQTVDLNELGPLPDFGIPAGQKRFEPKLVVDTTGSENEHVDFRSSTGPRKFQVMDAIVPLLVGPLGKKDAMAEVEIGTGKGGLDIWTYADREDRRPNFVHIGDVTPETCGQLWRPVYRGNTYAYDVLHASITDYREEHGSTPAGTRPRLLEIFFNDGQLFDLERVDQLLAATNREFELFYILVIGSGPDHDAAVDQWKQLSATHQNIFVEALTGVTNHEGIAERIVSIAEQQ